MIVNYALSDLFASLNVAKQGHLRRVCLNYNKPILNILKKLQDLGFLGKFRIVDRKKVEIFMKYSGVGPKCAFNKIVTISKPSKRIYLDLVKFDKYRWRNYAEIYLIYTKLGLFTNLECYLSNISGEILCKIEF